MYLLTIYTILYNNKSLSEEDYYVVTLVPHYVVVNKGDGTRYRKVFTKVYWQPE